MTALEQRMDTPNVRQNAYRCEADEFAQAPRPVRHNFIRPLWRQVEIEDSEEEEDKDVDLLYMLVRSTYQTPYKRWRFSP